jgi:hypothetical protein
MQFPLHPSDNAQPSTSENDNVVEFPRTVNSNQSGHAEGVAKQLKAKFIGIAKRVPQRCNKARRRQSCPFHLKSKFWSKTFPTLYLGMNDRMPGGGLNDSQTQDAACPSDSGKNALREGQTRRYGPTDQSGGRSSCHSCHSGFVGRCLFGGGSRIADRPRLGAEAAISTGDAFPRAPEHTARRR